MNNIFRNLLLKTFKVICLTGWYTKYDSKMFLILFKYFYQISYLYQEKYVCSYVKRPSQVQVNTHNFCTHIRIQIALSKVLYSWFSLTIHARQNVYSRMYLRYPSKFDLLCACRYLRDGPGYSAIFLEEFFVIHYS